MKKFLITESEIDQIKSLYVSKGILSKNILNEGIPGLSSAIKVGMKQGLKDGSKTELKKLLQQTYPTKNADEVFDSFEREFATSANKDKVIEKYFKKSSEDTLEDFCRILAKENPATFSRYSLDVISTPETSRVIRYATEHPEKYTLEQLEKINSGYRDIINNLDETDPFTLEVKQNLETQYGEKLKSNINSKKGSEGSGPKSEKDRPVNDEDFGKYSQGSNEFVSQIDSYLPPNNQWDQMGDKFGSLPVANRLTSEYVRNLNKLETRINNMAPKLTNVSTDDLDTIVNFIQAYTSTKFARDINAKQIERMYNTLIKKLSPQDASLLKQLSDVAKNGKLSGLGQTGYKNIDNVINVLGAKADGLLDFGTGILRKVGRMGKYTGEWLVAGLIVYYILSMFDGGGKKSGKSREYKSKYED